jgi:glutathione S-transferase
VTTPVLYHIEVSHYNEKARWALDYKGVPHKRKAPMPMAHLFWALVMTRGQSMTFPILKLNGDTVPDSTAIIARLEQDHPEPPLYPSDPGERRRALELEEFFDEELAPHLRRAAFALATRDAETFAWIAAPHAGKLMHAGFKGTAALAGPITRMRYGINDESAAIGREKTTAAFERLESEVGPSGYLVGDSFSVADLTAAALFFPLVRPPEAAQHLTPGDLPAAMREMRAAYESRPGFQWVQEMYRRHRGTTAAV